MTKCLVHNCLLASKCEVYNAPGTSFDGYRIFVDSCQCEDYKRMLDKRYKKKYNNSDKIDK